MQTTGVECAFYKRLSTRKRILFTGPSVSFPYMGTKQKKTQRQSLLSFNRLILRWLLVDFTTTIVYKSVHF